MGDFVNLCLQQCGLVFIRISLHPGNGGRMVNAVDGDKVYLALALAVPVAANGCYGLFLGVFLPEILLEHKA